MEKAQLTDYFEKGTKKIAIRRNIEVKGINLESAASRERRMKFKGASYLFDDLIKAGFNAEWKDEYLSNYLVLTFNDGAVVIKYFLTNADADDRMNDALAASDHPITTNFK